MIDHTVKSYDKELETLERHIAEMGGIAEKMVVDAMDALSSADVTLAQQVVATDPRLDALQRADRGGGGPDHRATATDGGGLARNHRRRSASPAISNGSATSPRTSPSAR